MSGAGRGIPGYPKPLVGIASSAVCAVIAAIPFGLEGWIVGALVGAAIGDRLIRRMTDEEDDEEETTDAADWREAGDVIGEHGEAGNGTEDGDGDENAGDGSRVPDREG